MKPRRRGIKKTTTDNNDAKEFNRRTFVKLVPVLGIAAVTIPEFASQSLAQNPTPTTIPNGLPEWAYNIPDKVQPPEPRVPSTVRVAGSSKEYEASAIAAIFAATGQDLGMVGTSSMAHGTAHRTADGGLHCALRLPGVEVGTVGGGTTLPYARSWLELLGCAGSGKVYRFAQIVAATTLALELSASAAMATAGSEDFFRAHHERGGLR